MPRTVNVNYVTKEVKILLHDSETESLAAATAIAAAESAQEAKDVVVDNLQDSLDAIDAKTETEKTEIATLGQEYVDSASQKVDEANTILTAIRNEYGYPFTATTAADMTDTTKIYVYVGNETDYINGNWYYYNGSAWVSGGIYNAVAFTTDTTLTVSGAAADSKATGDALAEERTTTEGELSTITSKMELVKSKNLLDYHNVTSGKYISIYGVETTNSSYSYFYIDVEEGDVINAYGVVGGSVVANGMRFICAYDSTGTAKSSKGSSSDVTTYTVPAGITRLAISVLSQYISLRMVLKNNVEAPTEYIPYFAPYYIATHDFIGDIDINTETNYISEYMEVVPRNYLKASTCDEGKFITIYGVISDNASYFVTDYIPVTPGQTLYCFQIPGTTIYNMSFRTVCAYDSNKTVKSSSGVGSDTHSYTVPNGISYVRFAIIQQPSNNQTAERTLVTTVSSPTEFYDYAPTDSYVIRKEFLPNSETLDDTPTVYLPPEICVGVGRTIELYNELVCRNVERYHLHYTCNIGVQYARKFTIEGIADNVGTYTLTLDIFNDAMKKMWTGTSTVKVVANNIASNLKVLPIGDSLTNRKPWLSEVQTLSNGKISFIGTRGRAYDGYTHEGRSGWSAASYLANTSYSFDNYYVGNPNFSPTANPFWDTANSKFSLSYWMTNQASTVGTPDVVQIFLGTNGIAVNPTTNVANIVAMVDAIQDEYPTMPIFVCNTIYKSNQNGFYSSGGDGYEVPINDWSYNADLKIMNLQIALAEALEGYSNVYLVPLSVCMDRENDFGQVEVPVNPRLTTVTTTIPNESTHPQNAGYMQIADVIYSSYVAHLS